MTPEKKPHFELFIVTPTYGAYDRVEQCVKAVRENTRSDYHHLLVNDNYAPLQFAPSRNLAIINVYNDPSGTQHVEQIGKMMDLGLAYGRNFITFKHFVKLESDCMVQPDWDKILIEEANKLGHYATLEAYSRDMPDDKPFEKGKTYGKPWVEMNCCLISPEIMNMQWCFSMVPHAVDQHLSKHWQTLSGDLFNWETTCTHIDHYRNSSRSQIQ